LVGPFKNLKTLSRIFGKNDANGRNPLFLLWTQFGPINNLKREMGQVMTPGGWATGDNPNYELLDLPMPMHMIPVTFKLGFNGCAVLALIV
jgi:hypothetical protein